MIAMIGARILAPCALACACLLGAATPQALPTPAPAAVPGGHDRMDAGHWLSRMADKLQLTEAQRTSCKAILDKHKDALASGRKDLADARQAFFTALRKPDAAPDALKPLYRSLSDLEFNQMMERRALRQELHAVLTPEQREQAARLEGRREGMRMARHGMRRGMGWHPGDAVPAPVPAPAAP
jgi:Spy/CpxP family protein refolding chaperone